MKPGDVVRLKESSYFSGKFPPFYGERTTYSLVTGVGIVLEIKFYDEFGTGVHILTPCGHGWTYPYEVEVIQ